MILGEGGNTCRSSVAVKCPWRTVVSGNKSFDPVILTWRVISRGLRTTIRWDKMFVGSRVKIDCLFNFCLFVLHWLSSSFSRVMKKVARRMARSLQHRSKLSPF